MPEAVRADLLRELHEGGYGREIVPTLLKVRQDATTVWRESRGDEAVWSQIQALHAPMDRAQYERALGDLLAMPLAQTKAGKDHAGWVKARAKLLEDARSQDWPAVLKSTLIGAVWVGRVLQTGRARARAFGAEGVWRARLGGAHRAARDAQPRILPGSGGDRRAVAFEKLARGVVGV